VRHVAYVGGIIKAYNPKGGYHLEDLDINGRIILLRMR
jgi:hypothetical protein